MIRIVLFTAVLFWLAASCSGEKSNNKETVSVSSVSSEITFKTDAAGDTVIIINECALIVKRTDEAVSTTWYQAQEQCEKNADGWRLPTKTELACLYKNKVQIGGFKNDWYWSSERVGDWNIIVQSFTNGRQFGYSGSNSAQTRLVKNLQE